MADLSETDLQGLREYLRDFFADLVPDLVASLVDAELGDMKDLAARVAALEARVAALERDRN
jgi:hypothetical protein